MVMSLKSVPGVIPVVGVKFAAAFAGVDAATKAAATASADAKSRGRFMMLFSLSLLEKEFIQKNPTQTTEFFPSTQPKGNRFVVIIASLPICRRYSTSGYSLTLVCAIGRSRTCGREISQVLD
jgi:hypothetical protein